MCCISLNNSWGQSFFCTEGAGNFSREGAIIQWKRLFHILLTGSHALNIHIFFCRIKSKTDHIKKTEHGLFKCSKSGSLMNFQCQYPRCQS